MAMIDLDANIARYYFSAVNLPDDTFQVVRFTGVEEVSQPFRYEVHLVSEDPNIDFAAVVNQPATLMLMRGVETVPLQGIVSHLEQAGRTTDHIVYRAVLMPRLWLLSLTSQSRIFQQQAVHDVVEEVLQGAGLSSGTDFRFDLSGSYAPREYCVQYRESDLNFVSRLLEHEGISYYFEHDDQGEVLVMTDDRTSHPRMTDDQLVYNEGAGMVNQGAEFVDELVCQESVVTGQVTEADYNWQTPETEVEGTSQLNPDMPGELYTFGEHVADSGQAEQLASIRNEELECRRRLVRGQSNCPALRAGYKFTLNQHYRDDLNEEYLVTRVRHQGSQRYALGLAGVDSHDGSDDDQDYVNQFECIPARVQYRPPRTTPVPRLPSLMTAKVDSAGGDYAYIDDDGSYRAIMPFDRSGKSGGNASLPIRMAQPYSGPDYGMHFPLHQNTEIVWGCIDGDVDRPVALGTVPNPTNTSPSTSNNKPQNVIRTWGRNELTFDDTKGSENILMKATKDHTVQVANNESISVGNDQSISAGHDRSLHVENDETTQVGNNETITVGNDRTETVGNNEAIEIGNDRTERVGNNETIAIGNNRTETVGSNETVEVSANRDVSVGANESLSVGAHRTVSVGGNEDKSVSGNQSTSVQGNLSADAMGNMALTSVANVNVDGLQIALTGKTAITLQVGPSSIKIDASGITISGPKIESSAVAMNEITGPMVKIN